MNILVIAPHPDDEALGCGGTLALHQERGDRVAAVFLTSGELGLASLPREAAWRIREGEAERAAEVLGIAALHFLRCPDWFAGEHVREAAAGLAAALQREQPGLLYLPHPGEWHPDHQAALPVARAAIARSGLPGPHLLAYEVWSPLAEFDEVEDVTATMARKLRAVRCYRSQLAGIRYDRAVRGLNQYRGIMAARCRYAEVFRSVAVRRAPGAARSGESALEAARA